MQTAKIHGCGCSFTEVPLLSRTCSHFLQTWPQRLVLSCFCRTACPHDLHVTQVSTMFIIRSSLRSSTSSPVHCCSVKGPVWPPQSPWLCCKLPSFGSVTALVMQSGIWQQCASWPPMCCLHKRCPFAHARFIFSMQSPPPHILAKATLLIPASS